MSDLSLLSTAGIQDRQVRNYLDRLTQVINEQREGENRLVKASEIPQLTGEAIGQALADGVIGGANPSASAINNALDNLTASIRRGVLYQLLEQGINVDDLIGQARAGGGGESGAGISEERNIRAQKDSVLASAINRIWSYVGGSTAVIEDGGLAAATPSSAVATKWNQVIAAVTDPNTGNVNSASILQETRAYANSADSTLNAIYSVRAQVSSGGQTVVGGFGLAATSGAGSGQGPNIDFGVLANRFYIAAPSGTYNPAAEFGSNTQFPFVVVTTNTVINGKVYTPGVYMKKAVIGQATIGLAQIDTASINSLSALTATIGVLRTAATGGRMELRDNVLKVFDENGTLRVQLGNLDL